MAKLIQDEDGNKQRGNKDPTVKNLPRQVAYRHRFHRNEEIRRVGEQIHPPRWHAQLDIPRKGPGNGTKWWIDQWQPIDPPFFIFRVDYGAVLKGRRAVARKFRGESNHKVDAKGRVSIPALFRRVIEAGDPNWASGDNPELVIVYGDERRKFLECYTMEAIDEVDAQIAALPRGSAGRKFLQQMFNGQSFPTTVDETGRLVLPAKLRKKIGLDKEAFFIAAGDTFQIWKPETYDEVERAQTESWLADQPDDFDPMSFLDSTKEA